MICRYCKTVYSSSSSECYSCGAPKGAIVQTVLDGSTDSENRFLNFRVIFVGVAIVTAVTLGSHISFGGVEWLAPFSFFWAMLIAPSLLCAASIASLQEGVLRVGINLFISVAFWAAIGLLSLIIL